MNILKDIIRKLISKFTEEEFIYNNYFLNPLLKYESLIIMGQDETEKAVLTKKLSNKKNYVLIDESKEYRKDFLQKITELVLLGKPFILLIRSFKPYPDLKRFIERGKKSFSLGLVSVKTNNRYGVK